ncbi:hypothetical protein DFH08DRAFT_944384 [Mycena albidolilacea]|uniref:Uncharacterized protein n=1 Tax=Mycena albidolilacea TaxID=1033008 RepID=A0AAD6Z663_9AGAR|nr:hypothetical protein DFH08DRAFT_944384 [Mycena albidolilacea]
MNRLGTSGTEGREREATETGGGESDHSTELVLSVNTGEVRTQYMDIPGDTCKDTAGPCTGPHPQSELVLPRVNPQMPLSVSCSDVSREQMGRMRLGGHDLFLLLTSTFIAASATHPLPIPPTAWDCMSKIIGAVGNSVLPSEGWQLKGGTISVCKTVLVRTHVYFHLWNLSCGVTQVGQKLKLYRDSSFPIPSVLSPHSSSAL